MLESKTASFRRLDFRSSPPLPVLHHVQEYSSYLNASRLTDMRASDHVLTICNRHNVSRYTDSGAWVIRWLPCDGGGISASQSHCIGSEVDCLFVLCHEEVEYENKLSTLAWRFDGQQLTNMVRLLSSYVFPLVTSISPNLSTIGHGTVTLSLVCAVLRLENLLAGKRSNCAPLHGHIGLVITLELQAAGKSWRGFASFAFHYLRSFHITPVKF